MLSRVMATQTPDEVPNLEIAIPHLDLLLSKTDHPKTLCPSEVARALSATELSQAGVSSWRELMPSLRALCFQKHRAGELEILQRGEVLPRTQDMESTKGPIRIRKVDISHI
jgi:hypothetical protein